MSWNRPRCAEAQADIRIQIIVILVLLLVLVFVVRYRKGRETEQGASEPRPTASLSGRSPGAPLPGPFGGKATPIEKILPPNTYFLLTFPNLRMALEKSKSMPLNALLSDPSWKDSLSRFFDSVDEFRARIEVQYGIGWADLQQALRGQCAVAVVPPEEPGKPVGVLLAADAPTLAPRISLFMDNVLKKWVVSPMWIPVSSESRTPSRIPRGPMEPRSQTVTSTFEGFSISSTPLSGLMFHSVSLGETFILSSTKKAVEEAIKRQTRKAPALADANLYKQTKAKISGECDLVMAYLNLESLQKDFQGAMTQAFADLLKRLGFTRGKALAYSAAFTELGLQERFYLETPEPRAGLAGLVGQRPAKRELLRHVPANALWCVDMGLNPAAMWAALKEVCGEAALSQFEKANSLDIQKDLCPLLGDEMVVYGGPPEPSEGAMVANLVFIAKATNPVAAAAVLEKILLGIASSWPAPETPAFQPQTEKPAPVTAQAKKATPLAPPAKTAAPAAAPQPSPVKKPLLFFADVPHRNHLIRTLTPSNESGTPNLSLAKGKDYVLIARTPDLARTALDMVDNLRPGLSDDPTFVEASRRVPAAASAVFYFNNRQNLEVMQRLLRERGQDMFRTLSFPIDYARLPITESATKKLGASIAWVLNEKPGLTIEASTPAGVAGTLILFGMGHTSGLPERLDPKVLALQAVVARNLGVIGAAMRRYAAEHEGSLPPGGRQAQELVASGYLTNLRYFYLPLSSMDFASFPENIDYQFTILNYTLTSDPKTPIAWERRKDAAGGRHVLRLDGTVVWMPEKQFLEQMK